MKITEKKVRNERSTEYKFDNGAWVCVYSGDEDGDGSWEYQSDEDDEETYFEGGLWFEEKEVVDYDGIYELPEEVKLAIRDMGYELTMSRRYKYLFTVECYYGGLNHVSAYGKRSRKEVDEIVGQMERYSQYDFCCSNESDTEEEYNSRLQALINDGAEVKYYNQ